MKILLLILAAFFTHSAFSQNIGIGTTAPKSKLHIAGGLRVDTLINNQDSGLLRHDKNGVVYSLKFTGNAADVLRGNGSFGPAGAASSGWSLTGNSGINPANNFIGTTDDQPLLFKINNVAAGVIDRGKLNTVLGYSALPNNNGQKNTVIGYQAMLYNTTGDWNTANGYWALRANTTGKFNTAMGTGSLWNNLSGNANTAIGNDALSSNTEGVGNSAFGLNALKSAVTGDFNTAIGTESDVLGGGLSNATAIGAYTRVDCSNCMILGSVNGVNTATNNVNVGIGVTNPKTRLHVAGSLRFDTLNNTLDSGLIRHDKTGVVYSLKFTGNVNDVLRGNGSFGPAGAALVGWSLTGNSGINPANNFIGTTDNQPLVFKVNNSQAGRIGNTGGNTFLGYQSGVANANGTFNSGYGYQTLNANISGSGNIAVGMQSLFQNVSGNDNTAVGLQSLKVNSTGNGNTAVGKFSLFSNTTGYSNVAIGTGSLYKNIVGTNLVAIGDSALYNYADPLAEFNGSFAGNTAVGSKSLFTNTGGDANVAIGNRSLYSNVNGAGNTAVGTGSLFLNSSGNGNTAEGIQALRNNTIGNFNSAMGHTSLSNNKTGNGNTAAGYRSLFNNWSGNSNVAIGTAALYSNDGNSNLVAIGDSALYNNVNGGVQNTAVGSKALFSNTIGFGNTASGNQSLSSNLGGSNNTAIGNYSLNANTTGNGNTSIGVEALSQNTTGSDNTAIGSALLYNTSGLLNIGIGSHALMDNTIGNLNIGIGHTALQSNYTGNNNIAIGFGADVLATNLSNAAAIGTNAKVGASNCLVLGGINSFAVKVGIGVTSPIATLHVKGSAKFFSGADTHTGEFYAGTSNQDGIELVSSGTDAYASIQRTSNYGLHISKKNVIGNNGLVGFLVNGILVGSITTNGTNTSYLTTSDKRLKENIVTSKYGLQTILQIKVADYNYKADNKKALQTGFLAQDLYELYPQAVEKGGDNEKTNPWMIDYSKLTPLLVKSIQDQQQIIERQQQEMRMLYEKIEKLSEQVNSMTSK